jgi:hypothetical protein
MDTKKECVWCGIQVEEGELWAVYADGVLVCECGLIIPDGGADDPEQPCISTLHKGTERCISQKS